MNSPSPEARLHASAREEIEAKTRGEIEAYVDGRGKTRIHEGARNLSLNVSDDYGNRFLVELIQNAHDAHPTGVQGGEIAVVFDPAECEYGCLYVANRGNGFSKENFKAITNIALSSKPVNESIGNKGLGFRSVLQICQWPEIYSVSESGAGDEFDGYCFRFAHLEDVASFLHGSEVQGLADEILANMPCWYLPVYASNRPGLVSQFASDGFASVVRLPLVSEAAQESVVTQLDSLFQKERPLHLFLDRISRIVIERKPGERRLLERNQLASWSDSEEVLYERLKVGDDEYLIANYTLPDAVFRKQLVESLSKKEVPEAWRNWRGAAKVSVAVRLGKSIEKGGLYCFLPLGDEVKAPFSGYINANFYTKMDRRSVNEGIGLNRFFMRVAALLSGRAINFLIKQNWPEAPGAVVDLLCWNYPYAEEIKNALKQGETGWLDRPLLPVHSSDGEVRWEVSRKAVMWNMSDERYLSSRAVIRVSTTPLLHTGLAPQQQESLCRFFLSSGVDFKPPSSLLAEWIERVAQELMTGNLKGEDWANFYDEITAYIRPLDPVLFGRKFLLGVGGELISAELGEGGTRRRRAADVYFPPVMSVDADVDDAESRKQLPLERFPAGLQKGFALLSRDIPWTHPGGGYRPCRAYFLEAKLVREYDTREAIRTLANITQSDGTDKLKQQALEWAFRLWSSGRSLSDKETRAAGFFVPTRTAWRASESSMFGSGWAGTANGKRLESFLKAAGERSAELETVRGCLLLNHSDWPIKFGREDDWVRFLRAAGVTDHLRPVGAENRLQKDQQPLSLAYDLSRTIPSLPEAAVKLWFGDLQAAALKAKYSTVVYRGDCIPWRIPGQCDLEQLSADTRKEFAAQIIRVVSSIEDEHLTFRVFRPGKPTAGQDPMLWPTPLVTLLKKTPWVPVLRGGGSIRFVAPEEAWHFNTDDDAPPRFMEIIAPSVAKVFDIGSLEWLRKYAGLRTLNDDRDVTSAISAYADVASGGLTDARDVKRFRELFGDVWSMTAPLGEGIDIAKIPVSVGGRIGIIDVEGSADEVEDTQVGYLVDEDDAAKMRLLQELETPLFDFGKADPDDTAGWLDVLAPGCFKRVSEINLEVLIDGERFNPSDEIPQLAEVFGSWIVDFIVCIASIKGGKFFQATQSTLAKVRRAAMSMRLLITDRSIHIAMAGKPIQLPASLNGAIAYWQGQEVVLIIQAKDRSSKLALLARSAEQLAAALQYPVLVNALDASLLRLASQFAEDDLEAPADDAVASALGCTPVDVLNARQYARTDLSGHLTFARLLAECHGANSEHIVELASQDEPTEEAVRSALEPLATVLGCGMDRLIERLGVVSDPRELMQEFEVPLVKINEAIQRLPGEFKRLSNELRHKREMDAYLFANGERIRERIREYFVADYDKGESLVRYVTLRDAVAGIQPDPEWFYVHDELTDELLERHVAEWLDGSGASGEIGQQLTMSLKECRENNLALLRDFWQRFGTILSAWVLKSPEQVTKQIREAWADPVSKRQEFVARANSDGWLDFRLLDDQAIVTRLTEYGVWPPNKPSSPDLSAWGLTKEDLQSGERKAKEDRDAERIRRQMIFLDKQEFSAAKEDLGALIGAVTTGFGGSEAFKDLSGKSAKLSDLEKRDTGGGSGGGSGGRVKRSPEAGLSDEQKKAIGLIGELYAREWIKRHFREKHGLDLDDTCWVSGYRNAALGSETGKDDLGYDFVVKRKSVTHYYEVKASEGDSHIFEMGPTEIAAAHKFRSGKDHKYWVIYIANATDSKRVEISLLPNPFSREGESKLRPVGRGSVTFEFLPAA